MEIIKYHLTSRINTGTETDPIWEESQGPECVMKYSEANLAIAQAEAFGDITVEDDGNPDQDETPTLESRVETLEAESTETKEALEMILSGVTE